MAETNNKEDNPDSDDPVVILRKSWCDYFEFEVECPVCYDIPEGNIFQCTEGHSFCHICVKKVDVCPLCDSKFTGTRNRVLEKLIPKIIEFKECLMDPSKETEKCLRVKKVCRSTQTLEEPSEKKLEAVPEAVGDDNNNNNNKSEEK
ncbi:Similar to sinah: Probable E3 ubiquitin-protein ligase sinah (Drosophila melanogaster) [Cotesia congregata]|uniref:Similar to sinah: Probable E3 ubiquitin-protein ligase sinah (Drosophila melanogaster) n=1 Tax=Cotesia congregata TaxID=51543 RepID=A0A8J2H6N0_COTCN|nr:Similar to sinah: Probable E3 ubiquitin-protein ligase sinah (Drosophila melanogaster) [Cotesia congregata]